MRFSTNLIIVNGRRESSRAWRPYEWVDTDGVEFPAHEEASLLAAPRQKPELSTVKHTARKQVGR